MCLHASWLKEEHCSRCTPPKKAPTGSGTLARGETRVKRVSTLPHSFHAATSSPSSLTSKLVDGKEAVRLRCVGCKREVNPAFCYTGSVLSDLVHAHLVKEDQLSEVFVLYNLSRPGNTALLGGEVIKSVRKVAFRKREKGLICDSCAANITTVTSPSGERVPLVMTDAKPGVLGETLAYSEVSGEGSVIRQSTSRRGPAFNTRVTQGRRGKRV